MSRSRLRLSGGSLGGRPIGCPPGIRPTSARMREALFDIWRDAVPGCRFLDLFAGSGAVGLEAISRGARWATLIDGLARAFAALRANARELAPDRTRALRLKLPQGMRGAPDEPYDLVFADPPYGFDAYGELLRRVAGWASAEGLLAVEHAARTALPVPPSSGWEVTESRRYGEGALTFFRRPRGAG